MSTEEYYFAVGSFKFKSFKELYDNIKGRTGDFRKDCNIVKGDKGVMSFPIRYENNPSTGKHRFVFELETEQLAWFNMDPDMSAQLGKYLPKLQVVGSVAKTAADVAGPAQKVYGFLNIAEIA